MKKFILLGMLIFLSACTIQESNFCGIETLSHCERDIECVADGCSGEVCRAVSDESYTTTCEWKDCYEKNGLECRCVKNQCAWN